MPPYNVYVNVDCSKHLFKEDCACAINSFTFSMAEGVSLKDLYGKTLLRAKKRELLYTEWGAKDVTEFYRSNDSYTFEGCQTIPTGFGYTALKLLDGLNLSPEFLSLLFFYIATTGLILLYDIIRACNRTCPHREKNKIFCCKPYMLFRSSVDVKLTNRGYRRNYPNVNWDTVLNEYIRFWSTGFHVAFYVIIYLPLNAVFASIYGSGRTVGNGPMGVDVVEIYDYNFLKYVLTVTVLDCIAKVLTAGSVSFYFCKDRLWFCPPYICMPNCLISCCAKVALVVMTCFGIVTAVIHVAILGAAIFGTLPFISMIFSIDLDFNFSFALMEMMFTISLLRFGETLLRTLYDCYKRRRPKTVRALKVLDKTYMDFCLEITQKKWKFGPKLRCSKVVLRTHSKGIFCSLCGFTC